VDCLNKALDVCHLEAALLSVIFRHCFPSIGTFRLRLTESDVCWTLLFTNLLSLLEILHEDSHWDYITVTCKDSAEWTLVTREDS